MRNLWKRLFGPKPYGCYCGKTFRTDIEQSKHVWKHALEE